MPRLPAIGPRGFAGLAFLLGVALRFAGLEHANADADQFLIPWYVHARDHGIASLGQAFTNYTPFFTYLLLVATWFDGLAPPMALIKAISFPFELGCAVLAGRLLTVVDPRPIRSALAFAAVWLAPSVLYNGALWGQADSLWTFFILAALLAFCRDRPVLGMLAFAVAVSVKAQAVFLGPLVFGLALRGVIPWRWFAAIPAVYLALAVPTLLAGRSLADISSIYLGQARAFHLLSVSAANLYMFVPESWYWPGLAVGILLAAAAGLALAVLIARPPRLPPERLLFAAAVSLILMPFVLPKMHERYFYAFEVLIIVLACARPSLARFALLAQVTSIMAYLPYDGRGDQFVPMVAVTNLVLLLVLAKGLRDALGSRPDPQGGVLIDGQALTSLVAAVWASFLIQLGLLACFSRWIEVANVFPHERTDPRGMAVVLGLLVLMLLVRSRHRPPAASAAPA